MSYTLVPYDEPCDRLRSSLVCCVLRFLCNLVAGRRQCCMHHPAKYPSLRAISVSLIYLWCLIRTSARRTLSSRVDVLGRLGGFLSSLSTLPYSETTASFSMLRYPSHTRIESHSAFRYLSVFPVGLPSFVWCIWPFDTFRVYSPGCMTLQTTCSCRLRGDARDQMTL